MIPGQLSFDDLTAADTAQGLLDELIAAGEQPGIANRQRFFETWGEVHGRFGIYDHMAAHAPWWPWTVSITYPGGGFTTADELAAYDGPCKPTTLRVDLRPDRHRPDTYPGRPPYQRLYRGACLACDWEGGPHPSGDDGENKAVEDAHDHVYSDTWRTIPLAPPKPPTDNKATLNRWKKAVEGLYADTGLLDHPAGCPVLEPREHTFATRHHWPNPWGGYYLGTFIGPLEQKEQS